MDLLMTDLPHLAFPYRLGATVDQGSPAELAASALVIARTPRGHRDDLPAFGTTEMVFTQGPVDTERFAQDLAASDPRLDVDTEELLDLADTTIRHVRAAIRS
jgi:hypothetical protein